MTGPFQDEQCGLRSASIVNGGLELVLNNTLRAIEDGRRRVLDFLAGQALGDGVRNRLEVVFEELVSNTIRHGFASNSDQCIHVRVQPRPGLVEFTFEDDGIPFNPLEAKPPELLTSIETAKIGGMGLPLIAKFSTQLRYERLAAGDAQPGFAPSNRLIVAIAT
jgi:anti-sigma regulatory factor (Ser/Thr protein kinase)